MTGALTNTYGQKLLVEKCAEILRKFPSWTPFPRWISKTVLYQLYNLEEFQKLFKEEKVAAVAADTAIVEWKLKGWNDDLSRRTNVIK